LIKYSLPIAV